MNQNDWQQSPFTHKPKATKKTVSFVEALKNIGGQTVSTLKNDVIKGTVSDGINMLTGASNPSPKNSENPWANEWLPSQENDYKRDMLRRERHKEVSQIKVFDRNEEEVKKQIKELQDQLKALAKDLAGLSQSMAKAIDEEVTSPGTYHLNFFEKLKQLIILMRKQVHESQNWLEISYSRKKAQNSYWSGFKKSGTKFSLSSERYMATSSG
jgi:predicted RNase H-like nuclease (RuvC/YqgF family)